MQEGATAGFSVPGRRENCGFISLLPESMKRLGFEASKPKKMNFKLFEPESLIADFKEVGFKTVKTFYTCNNPNYRTYEPLWKFMRQIPAFPMMIKGFEDKVDEIEESFKDLFEEKYGSATANVVSNEVLVLICQK